MTAVPRCTAPSAACPGGACSCCSPCPQPGCPLHGSDLSPGAEEALGLLGWATSSPGHPVAPAPSLRVIQPPSTPPSARCASISAPPASLGPARENTVVSFYSCPAIIFSQLRITLAKPSGCLYCFKQGLPFSPAPANSSCASPYAGTRHLPPPKSIPRPCPHPFPSTGGPRGAPPGFASATTAIQEPLEGTRGSWGLRRAGMCSGDLPFSTLSPAAGSQHGRKTGTWSSSRLSWGHGHRHPSNATGGGDSPAPLRLRSTETSPLSTSKAAPASRAKRTPG